MDEALINLKIARVGNVAEIPMSFCLKKSSVRELKGVLVSQFFGDIAPLSVRVYASMSAFQAGLELANGQSLVAYGDADTPLIVSLLPLPSPKPAPRPRDSTREWNHAFNESRLPADALPSVSHLYAFVEGALPIKIPIASTSLSSLAGADPATLDKLFIQDDTAPSTEFYSDVVRRVLHPTRAASTEASFIGHWSCLVQQPVTSTVRSLCFSRNEKHTTCPEMQRPDFVSTLHRVCVLRGQQESPDVDIQVPREQLHRNLVWTYGTAPYMLAYATSGYECALYALVEGVDQGLATLEIGYFQTESVEDRLRLLLAVLQLTRLFEGIVSHCPNSARDEYSDIYQPNGVIVRLNQLCVAKSFPQVPRWSDIAVHLERVYRVIGEHGVPHTDELIKTRILENTFIFRPRGSETPPANLNELFVALLQVLETLVALHRAGWMHRDLRWPNVIKRIDVLNEWFLIDFVDAAPSPKPNSRLETLNTHEHAPEMFVEGESHTTAVDVWGVGALIDKCDLEGEQWRDSSERMAFLFRLLEKDPARRPTACEAFTELSRLGAARTSA